MLAYIASFFVSKFILASICETYTSFLYSYKKNDGGEIIYTKEKVANLAKIFLLITLRKSIKEDFLFFYFYYVLIKKL